MTVNTLIIEDSTNNREALKKILTEECPHIAVIGEADAVDSGYELIKTNTPDLVFLDIQIKGGTSFDILERLFSEDAVDFEMIFLTAHGNFENVSRALDYSALKFLTKPINSDKLKEAVGKLERKLNKVQQNAQIALVLDKFLKGNALGKRIAIHLIKGIIELIEVDNIMYLEADGAMTKVHLTNNQTLKAVKNLGFYDHLLVKDYAFFRISDKTVVNLDYVKRYNHGELALTLKQGKVLYASRRGGKSLREYLNNNGQNFSGLQNGGAGVWAFLRRLIGK